MNPLVAHGALTFAYTLFALYDIIVREVMHHTDSHPIPLPLFLLIREVCCGLLLVPIALATEGPAELGRVFWPREAVGRAGWDNKGRT